MRKRPIFTLTVLWQAVGDKASSARSTLSFLPAEEKSLAVRLRWPFPPACRGKGGLVDLACTCDGLFPLPVDKKCVLGLQGNARDGLSSLPVKIKNVSGLPLQAPGDNGRPLPSCLFLLPDAEKTLTALRKALGELGGLGGRAHDGLSSLPVDEKGSKYPFPRQAGEKGHHKGMPRSRKVPGGSGGVSGPKLSVLNVQNNLF